MLMGYWKKNNIGAKFGLKGVIAKGTHSNYEKKNMQGTPLHK